MVSTSWSTVATKSTLFCTAKGWIQVHISYKGVALIVDLENFGGIYCHLLEFVLQQRDMLINIGIRSTMF